MFNLKEIIAKIIIRPKCKHKWEFIRKIILPYYQCIICGEIKYLDYDENGNIKN